jgi:galactose mutarotase-like enzyme
VHHEIQLVFPLMLAPLAGSPGHWVFTASHGDRLCLVPERGGLVTGWSCNGEELLYFDAERFLDTGKSVRGGIPILFPVCGNLPGDRLQLPQGSYPMAQHGFARDLPWQLDALEDGSGIRLTLCDSAATHRSYPFAFQVRLEYRLERGALAISARVAHVTEDAEASMMPFAFGLHPYFSVPSLTQARLKQLPTACFDHRTAARSSTEEQVIHLNHGVDFRLDPAGSSPQLISGDNVVELQTDSPFAHVVVWSDPPRPMVCLEPWSACRGELSLELSPGEQCELHCRYVITAA